MKFVVWKDRKAIAKALKEIYDVPDAETGYKKLDSFQQAWGKKYYWAILEEQLG